MNNNLHIGLHSYASTKLTRKLHKISQIQTSWFLLFFLLLLCLLDECWRLWGLWWRGRGGGLWHSNKCRAWWGLYLLQLQCLARRHQSHQLLNKQKHIPSTLQSIPMLLGYSFVCILLRDVQTLNILNT